MIVWEQRFGHLLYASVHRTTYKGYGFEARVMFNSPYPSVIDLEYFYNQDNAVGWCYQEAESLLKQSLNAVIVGKDQN